MNKKVVYRYGEESGEYLGEDWLMPNPKRPGEYFAKDGVTEEVPPVTKEREVACWRGGKWVVLADLRGVEYWRKSDKSHGVIDEIGVSLDSDWTEVRPVDPDYVWDEGSGAWKVPFDVLKTRKVAEIRREADVLYGKLKANYSTAEVDSWSKQEQGARDLTGNPDSGSEDAVFVRTMAAERGVTVDELVAKILAAVAIAREEGAKIIGIQQRLEDEANAASNEEELEAVLWNEE